MNTPRAAQGSAVAGGRWYVAGGITGSQTDARLLAAVDMFDPVSGHWTEVAQLPMAGEYVGAAVDSTGDRVLFVGGLSGANPLGYSPLPGALLGAMTHWAPSMLTNGRYSHAVAFAAGRFVVSGGWGFPMMNDTLLDDAESLDPRSGAGWTSAGTMPNGVRAGHSMTTLSDGRRVLVVGGCRPNEALAVAEILDVQSGAWSKAAFPSAGRCRHAAVPLHDGRVLVAGTIVGREVLASAEVYDPGTDRWADAGKMHEPRFDLGMVVLPDGRVLVAGGTSDAVNGEAGALASVEIFDPATGAWTAGPPMRDARRWPSVAVLTDGVYVTGGANAGGQLASTERLGFTSQTIDASADTGDAAAGTPDATGDWSDAAAERDGAAVPVAKSGGCSCDAAGWPLDDAHTGFVGALLAIFSMVSRPRHQARRRAY